MNLQEYRIMYEVEDRFWWYVGMRRIFVSLLERHYPSGGDLSILDAGCGTGGNLASLRRFGPVTGVDLSAEALRFCAERAVEGCRFAQSSLTKLPFDDNSFDFVTSFDVICCIDDDEAAFGELARVLKPGGRLLVNLPAYNFLRSEHDVAVFIKRRYTRSLLAERFARAGLRTERTTYANTILFPVAAAVRLALKRKGLKESEARSDLKPLPRVLNRLLIGVLAAENALLKSVNLPFGLSVIGTARK